MIENIYSNVAGKEKEYPVSGRRPPKNVRQIGTFTGDFRIYVEDYVHTFSHWLAGQDHTERCVAVLVGEFAKSEYAREVYAYGAVTAEQACAGGKIEMSAQVWTQVYETIKHYFPDGEIVGWFCGGTSFTAEEKEEIFRVHLDHFAGADRILMLYDFLEQEEEFYRYGEEGMARQEGYYIYYEKNTEMQNYMIDQKQGRGSEEDVNDRAVQKIRARWNAEKKEEEEETGTAPVVEKAGGSAPQGGGNRFLYSVGVVMTAVALVAAASMLYNQERLKGFEQTLNKLLGNAEKDGETDVKEVSGNAGEKKENTGKEESKDEKGTMAWEITGGAQKAPENQGEGENKGDDPLPGVEKDPDLPDGASGAGGEEQSGRENEEDGKNGGGNSGLGTGGDPEADSKNNGGEEKNGNNDKENNSAGGAGGGNSGDPDNGNGSDNSADQSEPENTPTPGDAVQTGEIGGPGAAIDTSQMQIYTVKAGDTLLGICRRFYGNLEMLEYIKEINQLNDENLIYIDQELLLP